MHRALKILTNDVAASESGVFGKDYKPPPQKEYSLNIEINVIWCCCISFSNDIFLLIRKFEFIQMPISKTNSCILCMLTLV